MRRVLWEYHGMTIFLLFSSPAFWVALPCARFRTCAHSWCCWQTDIIICHAVQRWYRIMWRCPMAPGKFRCVFYAPPGCNAFSLFEVALYGAAVVVVDEYDTRNLVATGNFQWHLGKCNREKLCKSNSMWSDVCSVLLLVQPCDGIII